ncbi:MAG: 1-deoxy-D-xylulose-5-phosphate synthase [Planctomycetes bacterium]|nr:1-deoxy-D-xylulose-5-phosphate synthase [Planctomycetota bacterium]
MTEAKTLLDRVDWPEDLKNLSREQLPQLCEEMREFILETVSKTGGHLGSGMGVVELTVALHYLFDFREDRLVFDVGHQCYPHKILTGRKARMRSLRQKDGLSGFTNRFESPYDAYTMGHAGTAISTALGIKYGDSLRGRDRHVVALVGDAAFGCGVAFEAMNHGGSLGKKLIVILNDNHWSIAKTVGALSSYLTKIRSGPIYRHAKKTLHQLLQKMPVIGEKVEESLEQLLKIAQSTISPTQLFEALGTHYYGPIDGHDTSELLDTLEHVRELEGVVLLHVRTQKGKGVPGSETRPDRAHAAKPAPAPKTAGTEPTVVIPAQPKVAARAWTEWFADALMDSAARDERIVALTAAMPEGTGLVKFFEKFPQRALDCGIAEQHCVAFASGLATAGSRPVAAIYSTFLQRGYDQVFQEVVLQKLPVVFALDRAGVVGEDGATHNGIYDIAFLGAFPGVVMMAPRDGIELGMMLDFALALDGPSAIRYPRGSAPAGEGVDTRPPIELGKAETLRHGDAVAIVAYGGQVEYALAAATRLAADGIECEVVNARFAKPFDRELVRDLRSRFDVILTVEDHVRHGGFGSIFVDTLHELPAGKMPRVRVLAISDEVHEHASRPQILAALGLDTDGIVRAVREELDALERGGARFVARGV